MSTVSTPTATTTCPSWCDRLHLAGWRSHSTSVLTAQNDFVGEYVSVELSWFEGNEPKITIARDGEADSTSMEIGAEEAAHLAEVLILQGLGGQLADALRHAASQARTTTAR